MEAGGAVLIFPPRGESMDSFLGIQWGEMSYSPKGQYFIIDDWDRTDGPLRNGIEGTGIPVTKLKAIRRRGIAGDFTTLATWSDDEPFTSADVRFTKKGDVLYAVVMELPESEQKVFQASAVNALTLMREQQAFYDSGGTTAASFSPASPGED